MRVDMVCFENPLTFMGGVEVHSIELVRALRELGHDARLVTRAPDDGTPDEAPWGIPVEWIDVPLPRGPLPAYHHARLVRPIFHARTKRACQGAGIVHSQDDAGLGAAGIAPTVVTVHTDVVSEYEAAKKPLPQGIPQRALVAWDRARWRRYADRIAASIAVSPATAGCLSTHFGMDPTVIPNGLPQTSRIDHDEAREDRGVPFDRELLYLGRLAPVKRVDRLIQALAGLPDDVGLAIGGKGSSRDALEAQARELGVQDRVRFLGYVPEEDKHTVFAAADALALPSEHEGQPIVLLEALAQGCPLVVTDPAWLPEELQPHAHAAPLDAGEDALVDAIEAALADPRVEDPAVLTWRQVAQRTVDVYEQALDPA